MKAFAIAVAGCLIATGGVAQQVKTFDDYAMYSGKDLGVRYQPSKTTFKIWAPGATQAIVRLYKTGEGGKASTKVKLAQGSGGTWLAVVGRNLKNQYYTVQVMQNGQWLEERPDVYAKAVGVNGKRGMVVDLASTNPVNWSNDRKPVQIHFTDIVLYESHVRDISISKTSGIAHKGKFLGLTETGTRSLEGERTGIDHLKELGVTHLHLLPSFDFNSIDEKKPDSTYNWGYDPLNYNVPEGSYSSNPYDGNVRIREFKEMVQALHKNGIRVILDVVYNHTANLKSNFNEGVPGYYYRHNANGTYADGTGCGNETASERAMMRKFIVESVAYWATEYHLDGFRFDLMGIHDIETMNEVSDTLHKIDPTIFIYGEGWTAGASPMDESLRAVKKNVYKLHEIAAFSDDIRDGLRGPFDKIEEPGFVSGKTGTRESVMFGIVGATRHPQIDYSMVNHSNAPWALSPDQSINYASCHDDNTLFDRLKIANPNAGEDDLVKMDRLAQTVVFTSQGVPFLQSGAELLRTKKGVANSYNSPDSINEIDWSRKKTYEHIFNYYKKLIALRKNHPAFRMPDTASIIKRLRFMQSDDPLLICYQISNHANGDKWKDIIVILNGNPSATKVTLPEGNWTVALDGDKISEQGLQKAADFVNVSGTGACILFRL